MALDSISYRGITSCLRRSDHISRIERKISLQYFLTFNNTTFVTISYYVLR